MEKSMMEQLKEDAHMLAEMITAPLYGRPEREEELRNNEEHIANRLKQNK